VIFGDDTTLDLVEPGRGQTRTARMWAYVSAGQRQDPAGTWQRYPPAVHFEFTDTRESVYPSRFLEHYRGYLQADDYAGYHALYRAGAIVHVACWAHYLERRFIWGQCRSLGSSSSRRPSG